ncbi:hypothetical protein PN36_23660 [Candidatus Thiomargarita nelsonii]|uniref:N-acetyltransferase domain-containing protein n=1 Tax=Candidatus Thiomargarita nelsonii TaxID=1003181 RepID=A0A0A6RMC4_9GAMM|nr:hypothetical protein PN36_23660 [Candidatus Thiomargarita nelsonii]
MNGSKKIQAERDYTLTRYRVYKVVEQKLKRIFEKPIRLSSIDDKALKYWQEIWLPHNYRYPPDGGWDWQEKRTNVKRTTPERFEVAIWHNEILCGLALGKPSKGTSHNAIYLMEGSPIKHPLNALITRIVMEVGIVYANDLGKKHLMLVDPLEKMIKVYTKRYGFEFRTAKTYPKRFCIKKV